MIGRWRVCARGTPGCCWQRGGKAKRDSDCSHGTRRVRQGYFSFVHVGYAWLLWYGLCRRRACSCRCARRPEMRLADGTVASECSFTFARSCNAVTINDGIGRAGAKLGPSTDTGWWRRSVWTGPEMGRRAAEMLRLLAESRAWSGQCVEQASSEAVVSSSTLEIVRHACSNCPSKLCNFDFNVTYSLPSSITECMRLINPKIRQTGVEAVAAQHKGNHRR